MNTIDAPCSTVSSTLPENTPCYTRTIQVRIYYEGWIIFTIWQPIIPSFDKFITFIRQVCRIGNEEISVKWIDSEGDPCTLSNDLEICELIRLVDKSEEHQMNGGTSQSTYSELVTMRVFVGKPLNPGDLCPGERIGRTQRHNERRWRKLYVVGGHHYQISRFNRYTTCTVCNQKIWGFGSRGYHCIICQLRVHKRCHKFVSQKCQPTSKYKNDITFSTDILKHNNDQNIDRSFSLDSLTEIKSELLSDYRLLHVVGRGSYAKVFQAQQRSNGNIYAMKVIKKSFLFNNDDIEWVQTEKHVLEQANNHPFLVGLHSSFQTDHHLFFIIDFVNGGDLMFHMQRLHRLPEDHSRFYCAEISIALNFLHKNGILYRDLKLDNVLLDRYGHIKLTDYGMCKEGLGVGERTTTFCGTPNYLAPEMLSGKAYGTSVDWWALGILTFEMLVGRSPFELGRDYVYNTDKDTEDLLFQIILEQPIRIPRCLSCISSSLLRGFLQKDPMLRLGCTSEDIDTSFRELISHPFFKSINFRCLSEQKVTPPFRPPVPDALDISCFDPQFTNEPLVFTPDNSFRPGKDYAIINSVLHEFKYMNPLT